MTTKAEVYDDLKAKVRELLKDIEKNAMEKLDKLQASGVGILDDHERNGMTFATPKDFIVAYAEEIGRAYTKPSHMRGNGDRKWVRLINNYKAVM